MDSETVEIVSNSPEHTRQIGKDLSQLLESGDVVALFGDLGSGKTILTKGICEGLGVKEMVTSPTFTLIQEYSGICPVYHFDFYRLNSIGEIEMLDLDCYFSSDAISIIEWADRGEKLLPESIFKIEFDHDSCLYDHPDQRCLKISAPHCREIKRLAI